MSTLADGVVAAFLLGFPDVRLTGTLSYRADRLEAMTTSEQLVGVLGDLQRRTAYEYGLATDETVQNDLFFAHWSFQLGTTTHKALRSIIDDSHTPTPAATGRRLPTVPGPPGRDENRRIGSMYALQLVGVLIRHAHEDDGTFTLTDVFANARRWLGACPTDAVGLLTIGLVTHMLVDSLAEVRLTTEEEFLSTGPDAEAALSAVVHVVGEIVAGRTDLHDTSMLFRVNETGFAMLDDPATAPAEWMIPDGRMGPHAH